MQGMKYLIDEIEVKINLGDVMKNFPQWRFKDEDGKNYPDWQETCLKDLGYFYGGLHGKTKENFGHGNAVFITYMNVYKNYFANLEQLEFVEIGENEKQNLVQFGDILFTQSSETVEEVAMSSVWLHDKKVYLNSFCMGFHPYDLKILDPQFAGFLLHTYSIRKNFILEGQGISRYNISASRIENIKFKIPCLEEQKKIADYLMQVEKSISAQEKELESWRLVKRGLLQKIFSRQYKFVDDAGNFYPDWQEKTAAEIFESVSDRHHENLEVLTILQGKGTVPRKDSGIDIKFDEDSRANYKRVEKGDFIIHLRTFQGGLEMANSEGIVSPSYTVLKNILPIDNQFFKAYFRSYKFIHGSLPKVVEGIRDGRQINYNQFKSIKLPYPSLEEQQQIGKYFGELDNIILSAEKILRGLKEMKRGLLQKLFI